MDEESLRKEFEEWVKDVFGTDITEPEKWHAWMGWRRAARRFDFRAREECAEIVRARKVAIECATEFDKAYNRAVEYLAQAIRVTIKEE